MGLLDLVELGDVPFKRVNFPLRKISHEHGQLLRFEECQDGFLKSKVDFEI